VIDGNRVLLAKASPEPVDSPFRTFGEWDSPADTKAYADL
jgi:antitoxin PrlF